jgi:hypothetical protein
MLGFLYEQSLILPDSSLDFYDIRRNLSGFFRAGESSLAKRREFFANLIGMHYTGIRKIKPLILYHGTAEKFSTFDPKKSREYGSMHFASKRSTASTKGLDVLRIKLNARNIIRISDHLGWCADAISKDIVKYHVGDFHLMAMARELSKLDKQLFRDYWGHVPYMPFGAPFPSTEKAEAKYEEFAQKRAELLRNICEKYEIDAFVYSNKFEGAEDSYMVFNPTLIEIKKRIKYKPVFGFRQKPTTTLVRIKISIPKTKQEVASTRARILQEIARLEKLIEEEKNAK